MFIRSFTAVVSYLTAPFFAPFPRVAIESEFLTPEWFLSSYDSTDIEPPNVLFNSRGQVKTYGFGVSGKLINPIADTFISNPLIQVSAAPLC